MLPSTTDTYPSHPPNPPPPHPPSQSAINAGLPARDVKAMCLKYAALERQLGEIDRARAIYVHSSQYADPRSDAGFWDTWHAFEIAHGNEDTFREMLRVKRTVSANYSQVGDWGGVGGVGGMGEGFLV